MEKFWTPEKQKELEEVGEKKFWTPERVNEYKSAMNFTIGSITGRIPHPEVLEKIRWRDVKPGDVIYFKFSNISYKNQWSKRQIISVKRLRQKNIIEITYKNIDAVNPIQHSMEVHGKKFTRLIARDSE